mmetsp:Transcript_13756/g.20748  ORF Transcript_13756/g.20748 Transcript_13756/m.20748 type:complete len:141 (+) Transcript_13756:197-619(+)
MASNTCQIPDEIYTTYNKWKRQKNPANCALIIKVNRKALKLEIEDEMSDTPIEDLAMDLPECAPRYVCYSYAQTHSDGRKSFPLLFLYYMPSGCNPELNMLYASTKIQLTSKLNIQKEFEVRNADDLTEEWLKKKLSIFG